MSEETKLRIIADGEDIPFPENSATYIQCSLTFIGASAHFERTVNARLVNLSDPAFSKLAISLSASDNRLPAIADMKVGEEVTVELPMIIRERGNTPVRQAVPGSVFVGSGWVEYRPVVECMLILPPVMEDVEWRPSASWSLQFEEV